MGLGDAIGTSNLHRLHFALVQQFVPGLGADFQCITHLLNVHHVGVLAQHDAVGIALVKSFVADTEHLFSLNLRI